MGPVIADPETNQKSNLESLAIAQGKINPYKLGVDE